MRPLSDSSSGRLGRLPSPSRPVAPHRTVPPDPGPPASPGMYPLPRARPRPARTLGAWPAPARRWEEPPQTGLRPDAAPASLPRPFPFQHGLQADMAPPWAGTHQQVDVLGLTFELGHL